MKLPLAHFVWYVSNPAPRNEHKWATTLCRLLKDPAAPPQRRCFKSALWGWSHVETEKARSIESRDEYADLQVVDYGTGHLRRAKDYATMAGSGWLPTYAALQARAFQTAAWWVELAVGHLNKSRRTTFMVPVPSSKQESVYWERFGATGICGAVELRNPGLRCHNVLAWSGESTRALKWSGSDAQRMALGTDEAFVVLVDDVVSSGTTMQRATNTLGETGVAVDCLVCIGRTSGRRPWQGPSVKTPLAYLKHPRMPANWCQDIDLSESYR